MSINTKGRGKKTSNFPFINSLSNPKHASNGDVLSFATLLYFVLEALHFLSKLYTREKRLTLKLELEASDMHY